MEQPLEQVMDPLIGSLVAGRYQIDSLSETDEVSVLYRGIDTQSAAVVGVRVMNTPDAHRRLHEWLKEAAYSRGRDAILAVGHIDSQRAFVIFAEAALDFPNRRIWLKQMQEQELPEESAEENGDTSITFNWRGLLNWRKKQ